MVLSVFIGSGPSQAKHLGRRLAVASRSQNQISPATGASWSLSLSHEINLLQVCGRVYSKRNWLGRTQFSGFDRKQRNPFQASLCLPIRPHVCLSLAACRAHEPRLKVGKPDIVRPLIGADRDVVAELVIRTIDQHAANAGVAHFAEGDGLRNARCRRL